MDQVEKSLMIKLLAKYPDIEIHPALTDDHRVEWRVDIYSRPDKAGHQDRILSLTYRSLNHCLQMAAHYLKVD